MKQKQKIQFKFTSLHKNPTILQQKLIPTSITPIHSQRISKNIDSMYEKIQQTVRSQNRKINALDNHYHDAMLERFDKLISVNQKLAKNIEKLVQKIDKPDQIIKPTFKLPPLKTQPKGITEIRALTSRRLAKPNTEQNKVQSFTSKNHSQFQTQKQDGWDNQVERKNNQKKQMMDISPCIKGVLSNFNPVHVVAHKDRDTSRFKNLVQVFQNIADLQCSEEKVSQELNKFVGNFFSTTTQYYFQEYSHGRLQYDDMKIKFSTQIINEVIEISQRWLQYLMLQNKFNIDKCFVQGQDFFRIFTEASQKSLEYLIHKYPPSRTKKIDTQLSQKIKQIKNYSIVKYDLLKNAGMEFRYVKGQRDFSLEIKKWINALIKQSKSQFPLFKQTMKSIFNNNESSLDGSKSQNDVQYLIGTKIPESTQLYTDDQMKIPGFSIKSPEILRILIKWYQELYSYFSNTEEKILQNKFGFKSEKYGSIPIRMPHSRLLILVQKLKNIYQKFVLPFKKQQFKNIGGLIQGLIGVSFGGIKQYDFLDQRQATITKLSEYMYQTFKSYMFIFLNEMIQNLIKVRSEYQEGASESCINLVTFNIMDLLRCKCTASKSEINRIYNDIMSKKDYFQVIRVKNKLNEPTRDILINLKLKNSFLVCEVQLSLGDVQQQVNDHFSHYLYQLHRSGFGVLFECASQIANLDPRISYMKKKKDLRFKDKTYFTKIILEGIQLSKDGVYCKSYHQRQKMQNVMNNSPYCCVSCNSFIEANQVRLPYLKCANCSNCICIQCISMLSEYDEMIMDLIFMDETSSFNIPDGFFKRDFLSKGIYEQESVKQNMLSNLKQNDYILLRVIDSIKLHQAVFKNYKSDITEAFSTLIQMPQIDVNTSRGRPLFYTIPLQKVSIKKLSQLSGYTKYHISMSWCQLQEILNRNKVTEVVCIIADAIKSVLIIDVPETDQQITQVMLQKHIKKQITNLNKNNQVYFQITSKNLKNINFLKDIREKQKIVTLNLWQNKISDIQILSQFSNIQQLYLQQNSIRSMDAILPLHNMQLLGISTNQICGEFPKLDMPHLQCAMFSQNKIQNIDNLPESNIPNIMMLKLYKNKISILPELKFQKLQVLMLQDCKINDLSQFSKSKLPSLHSLMLQRNQLKGVLPSFNFPKLVFLNLSQNEISSLIEFTNSQLPCLQYLHLHQNQISDCICRINLPELVEVYLDRNKIIRIQDQLLECKNLPKIEVISLRNNKISGKLPCFKLRTLKKLDFGQNDINDVSSLQVSIFYSIQQMLFDNNMIESKLPKLAFKTLKLIDFSNNRIDNIDNLGKWKCGNLNEIKLKNNRIQGTIPTIELYSLKYADLSQNMFKEQNNIKNIHLTPKIIKIYLSNNSQQLLETIKSRYSHNQEIYKLLEL